ncbi:MAG: hypothetical protein PHE65_07860, partial [Candidatus Omnitrophica bacterium]|nr:hypothetical protein [Candidatus Omnitrophota bacterium]
MPWHARILIKFDREGVIDLDEDLKTALRRMFPDSRDGGIEEELETIISSPSGKTPLANRIAVCEQLVSGWEGLMNTGDLTPSDVTVIQVATTRLASLTPFDQDVNSVDASMLVALYQKIVELSLRTYIRVKDMRSGEPRENKMFQLKAAKFIYMARYGCLYQHLVQLADAIALYRGVGLSRIRAEEIPGLLRYPAAFVNRVSWIMNIFVRYAWGFEYYARKYEKEFAASIGDIKSQGNHLVPGLYMQPGSPGAQRQDVRPDILIRQKKDVDVGVRRWWNSKVALFSYILPPLGQIAILALLAQLIVYFAGIGPLPDILVYVARIGFILMIGSIAANWLALRLNDKFYKQHMSVIDAYEGQLRQLGFDEYNNRLTDEEFGKLWDIWQAEMRSDVAPSLDAVVIAASWDVALTDSVRTLLSDKDIPVMIKRTRDAGSGMALMEMIDCWKSGATVGDFIRCVAEQGGVLSLGDATPSAYTKPLSKAHVAVILAGNTLIEANKSVIPWPVDAETRLLLSPVELALLNCIRSAHVSRAQGNSKGLIIHNGDGVFVGPIEGETLAAAWKNIRDVARWQSNVIISSADGIVERIYDRARMSFIRSKYPDSFDWNNVDKKQLLVSAGIITINKDLDLFVSYLHDLHGFLSGQPALQRRFGNTGFQIRLMPDIMTIWARLNRRKDLRSDVLASYFSARIDDLDRNDPYIDEYIDLLHAWDAWNYDWFRGIPSMRVSVHRPSHNGALYFRMSNDDALNKRNLDIIQRAADELAKSLRDGGVVSHRHSFLKDQVRKAKLLAAPYLDFPKKETQLRPLDKSWMAASAIVITTFYALTAGWQGLCMSAVWHGVIFGFDYLADQYNASRWHWRQWGMHKFQYPKFSGKLFGSMWKMLVMSALDLVILSQLVGLFPGAYWGIPGNYMVIIIRTIIVLPVGIKFSLWTRSLTHFSTSAKRLEIIKNVSFTLISTVFSAWFIQLDGTALFVALYSIAYKVVSEFVTFRIDTRHPPAANIFIAPDKKLAESPDEMVINGTRVHRMEIAEVIERMLAQGQAGLKTKYGFDIGSRKTYEAFLKNSERALDFLIEDGSRFDTNNPAHVRRLVAFIEQSLRAAGISEDVWALDAQRFGKRAERPQEILEFSREVPQLHEKLIEDRRLRDIITYGNLFEGSAAWDDVPSELEERNLPIAAWVKDEPFRDR